jgi:hypothetical protein
VETDLAFTGPLRNALYFSDIKVFPIPPADGGFNLDRSYRHGYATGAATTGFSLEVVDGEGSFAGCERDKIEAAKGLAAIAAVVEQVALLLNQHAAHVAREQAYREMIGERTGGEPHCGFLAKRGGDGLFELGDYSSARIVIGFDGEGEFLQKSGVLHGCVMDAVAAGSDRKRVSSRGCSTGSGSKNRRGKECSAVHMDSAPRISQAQLCRACS